MPRGDGTGPMGLGPMTGRAAGYCAGFSAPGFMNTYGYGPGMGYGFGMGYGRGMGFGRGFRRSFAGGAYMNPYYAGYSPYAGYPAQFRPAGYPYNFGRYPYAY
jgi:hypothetical protein